MSDEVKESMTPQEAEDVAAFLMLRRTGANFDIERSAAHGWYAAILCDKSESLAVNRQTLMEAVQKLAEKLPDVFDPAKGG